MVPLVNLGKESDWKPPQEWLVGPQWSDETIHVRKDKIDVINNEAFV